MTPGVVVGLTDDGPGDWPGSREVRLGFASMRPATKEEWDAHCGGLWPWDVPGGTSGEKDRQLEAG